MRDTCVAPTIEQSGHEPLPVLPPRMSGKRPNPNAHRGILLGSGSHSPPSSAWGRRSSSPGGPNFPPTALELDLASLRPVWLQPAAKEHLSRVGEYEVEFPLVASGGDGPGVFPSWLPQKFAQVPLGFLAAKYGFRL